MTEDEYWNEFEQRLKRKKENDANPLYRSNMAAAEYIQSQSADILAITNIRQAFIHGYRTGWRDREGEK